MIPIEHRVEHLFSSDFDIPSFLSILLHFFRIIIFYLLSLSIKVKPHLLILNLAVIHLPQFLPFRHLPLLRKEIQLRFLLLLEILSSFLILLVILHQDTSLIIEVVGPRFLEAVNGKQEVFLVFLGLLFVFLLGLRAWDVVCVMEGVLVTMSAKLITFARGFMASYICGAAQPSISIMNWSNGSTSYSWIWVRGAVSCGCSSSKSTLRSSLIFSGSSECQSQRLRLSVGAGLATGSGLLGTYVGQLELTLPHLDSFFFTIGCCEAGAFWTGGGGGGFITSSLSSLSSSLRLNFSSLALTCLMAIFLNLSSSSILLFTGEGSLGFSSLGFSCLGFSFTYRLLSLLLDLERSRCFLSFLSFFRSSSFRLDPSSGL